MKIQFPVLSVFFIVLVVAPFQPIQNASKNITDLGAIPSSIFQEKTNEISIKKNKSSMIFIHANDKEKEL